MAKKKAVPDGMLKARLLTACALGKVNDVVVIDQATADAGLAAGELDTNDDAVAYAEGLAAPAEE